MSKDKKFSKSKKGYKGGNKPKKQWKDDPNTKDMGMEPDSSAAGGQETKSKKFANDPSWYAKNEKILRDSASFSFNNPLGKVEDWRFGHTPFGTYDGLESVPGILTLKMVGVPGVGTLATDAINVAASDQYSLVRYMNSGSKNYEPADLMIYYMALDNAFMYYSWIRRLIGLLRIYSQKNKYWPKYLIECQDVNFEDLIANQAQFRAWANQFAAQLGPFLLPDTMSIFKRHWDLYGNVFTDRDSTKAQVYMYVPAGFYYFEPFASQTGGKLTYKVLNTNANPTGSMTITNIMDIGNVILNGILNIDDNGVIAGDIKKAFSSYWVLPAIEDDYMVIPEHSEEMLTQIHNATIFNGNISGAAAAWTNMDIEQANGLISFQPVLEGLANTDYTAYACGTRLMDFRNEEPSPAEVMVASRLIFNGEYADDTFTVTDCGTELVLGAFSYYISGNGTLIRNQVATFLDLGSSVSDGVANNYFALTNFDQAPLSYLFINDASGGLTDTYVVGDVQNYRFFDTNEIAALNNTALLSEFDVPSNSSAKY